MEKYTNESACLVSQVCEKIISQCYDISMKVIQDKMKNKICISIDESADPTDLLIANVIVGPLRLSSKEEPVKPTCLQQCVWKVLTVQLSQLFTNSLKLM